MKDKEELKWMSQPDLKFYKLMMEDKKETNKIWNMYNLEHLKLCENIHKEFFSEMKNWVTSINEFNGPGMFMIVQLTEEEVKNVNNRYSREKGNR